MEQLKKSDYAELPEVQRIDALATEGELISHHKYYMPLTDEDIAEKNIKLNNSIHRISTLEEERKDIGAEIKEQKKIIQEMHTQVTDKFVSVTEDVYSVIDTTAGVIETINKNGEIIESKQLKKGVQLNMYKQSKEAM